MFRPLIAAVCGLMLCADVVRAFEVRAVIKKVDAENGVLVVRAG